VRLVLDIAEEVGESLKAALDHVDQGRPVIAGRVACSARNAMDTPDIESE
jgi:hypothetical protein